MNLLVRQSVSGLREGSVTVQQAKENLISKSVKILTSYRRHCAQPGSSLGQLILPEALKLLPMYVTGAIKCDAIDGGPEMLPDDKSFAQIRTLGASLRTSQVILYPKLLKIQYQEPTVVNGGSPEEIDLLASNRLTAVYIRCSEIRLDPNAVCFLLENAFYLFLYVPVIQNRKQEQFVKNVFGVDSLQAIHPDAVSTLDCLCLCVYFFMTIHLTSYSLFLSC
jgi:protein transport protein SEC24